MLFASLEFLFFFFPVTLGINFLLPKKARNYWLFLASLFFYSWGEPKFVLAMLASIVFNYLMAFRIHELPKGAGLRRVMLFIAVLGNLALLFVFKYMNFITSVLRESFPALQAAVPQTEFTLPIGISFFTFQALSYVIDVYRGIPVQKNICYLGLYISLFPQLIAGPIVRYTTVADQIEKRTVTAEAFSSGVFRFLLGFNKKMLLANAFAKVADEAFSVQSPGRAMAWLGALCYSLQIFFDFSAYSDMAIGLGRIFGFSFLENFNYPYISASLSEFWRRWHISLGSWFRDYVYFPLGGSRVKSRLRLVFNLLVVWLATGIWHGANWTFLLWGLLHGFFIILEKLLGIPSKFGNNIFLRVVYRGITLLVVLTGWVLFRADSLSAAGAYLSSMFFPGHAAFLDAGFCFYFRENMIILFVGLAFCLPLSGWIGRRLSSRRGLFQVYYRAFAWVIQLALFLVSISCLVMNAHNPFIYFNF